MKRILLVMLLLSWTYSHVQALAAGPDEAGYRAEMVQRIQTANVPEDVKDRVTAIIEDDQLPFNEKEILTHFETVDENQKRSTAWRHGMLHAWCFRHRSSPEALARLYDQLPQQYRSLYVMLIMTQNEAYISPGYASVAEKALLTAVESANAASGDDAQRTAIAHASAVAKFVLSTGHPSALVVLEKAIRERAVISDLRFNLLAVALTREQDAEQIARWYWKTYCIRPQEISILARYFLRHAGESAAQALIEYKMMELQQAQVQLRAPYATQPVTTAPAQGTPESPARKEPNE